MARQNRPPFSPLLDFSVWREFTFDGKTLKQGTKFNWRELGCNERLLRQLYDQRKLTAPEPEEVEG